MTDIRTIIAGNGRCGTSLLMQMLDAGGTKVHGEFPDYEPADIWPRDPFQAIDWLRKTRGKAVKMLDPHNVTMPTTVPETCAIWIDRRRQEQAKSQFKLIGVTPDRGQRKVMERQLKSDRAKGMKALTDKGIPVLITSFESLIESPLETICLIDEFLPGKRDLVRMAKAILPRPSTCLPFMLEETLVAAKVLKDGLK